MNDGGATDERAGIGRRRDMNWKAIYSTTRDRGTLSDDYIIDIEYLAESERHMVVHILLS